MSLFAEINCNLLLTDINVLSNYHKQSLVIDLSKQGCV